MVITLSTVPIYRATANIHKITMQLFCGCMSLSSNCAMCLCILCGMCMKRSREPNFLKHPNEPMTKCDLVSQKKKQKIFHTHLES